MAKGKKKIIQLRASVSPILRYPQIYVDKLFITSVKLLCGAPAASHCLKHERRETKKLRNYTFCGWYKKGNAISNVSSKAKWVVTLPTLPKTRRFLRRRCPRLPQSGRPCQ